jgi:hypothetical protein
VSHVQYSSYYSLLEERIWRPPVETHVVHVLMYSSNIPVVDSHALLILSSTIAVLATIPAELVQCSVLAALVQP